LGGNSYLVTDCYVSQSKTSSLLKRSAAGKYLWVFIIRTQTTTILQAASK